MLFVDFPEANFTFLKPAEMTDEECGSLRVHKGQYPDGTPCIISKWKPSKEDIETIVNGGAIYLTIVGHGMPPVSLYTESPFENAVDEAKQP